MIVYGNSYRMVGRSVILWMFGNKKEGACLDICANKNERLVMNERLVDVVNGPDKFTLAWSLFGGSGYLNQQSVTFAVQETDGSHSWAEEIKLNSAEREDGSAERWNLSGHNVANGCNVKIYYNLQGRKGKMTFLKH